MYETLGLIVGVIGIGLAVVIIFLTSYYWKTPKPIPKPNIRLKEIKGEPDKLQFTIWNYVNDPAMKKYRAFFKVIYKQGGKEKTYTKRWKPDTQTKNITSVSAGTWEIDNLLNDVNKNKRNKIKKLLIKVAFEDNYERKYCYCGVYKKGEELDWVLCETKEGKDIDQYITYWRWKCRNCMFDSY